MDHVTIYLLHTYCRLACICDARYEIKPSKSLWYFVSNKHYFIEQKRGKKKYVIFLVLGKLLKRWWNACGSVSPPPSLKTGMKLKKLFSGFAISHAL
jgi:hypothetical protein